MIKLKIIIVFLLLTLNVKLTAQLQIVPYLGISHNEISIDEFPVIIDSLRSNFNPVIGIAVKYKFNRFLISCKGDYSKTEDIIDPIPVFDPNQGYIYSFWVTSLSGQYSPFRNLFLGLGFSHRKVFNYKVFRVSGNILDLENFGIFSTTLNFSYHFKKIQLSMTYSREFKNTFPEPVFPQYNPLNPLSFTIGYKIYEMKN